MSHENENSIRLCDGGDAIDRNPISGHPPSPVQTAAAQLSAMLFVLVVATIFQPSAFAQKPTPVKTTEDLPAGPMQAKATTACTECHEARIVLQQRLSKTAWAKEVDKMVKWGAVVDANDRDALIDYLSTSFSPEKSPYNPPRTSSGINRKVNH